MIFPDPGWSHSGECGSQSSGNDSRPPRLLHGLRPHGLRSLIRRSTGSRAPTSGFRSSRSSRMAYPCPCTMPRTTLLSSPGGDPAPIRNPSRAYSFSRTHSACSDRCCAAPDAAPPGRAISSAAPPVKVTSPSWMSPLFSAAYARSRCRVNAAYAFSRTMTLAVRWGGVGGTNAVRARPLAPAPRPRTRTPPSHPVLAPAPRPRTMSPARRRARTQAPSVRC